MIKLLKGNCLDLLRQLEPGELGDIIHHFFGNFHRISSFPLIVVYPFLLSDQLDHCDDHDHCEHKDRNCCCITFFSIHKRILIEQNVHGLYFVERRVRYWIDHHIDAVEYLERTDQTCDHYEKDRWRK